MKKIMIVDDSAFSRNIHRQILESGGYQVIEAASGTDALALYKTEKPDAVTMDLLMPDMDGMDAARGILKADSDARIVICSTDKQKFRKKEAKEIGAKGFVAKPIDPEELLELLEEIFE